MAFHAIETYVVEQAIAVTSTTKKHDLGTIVQAVECCWSCCRCHVCECWQSIWLVSD